MLVLRRRAAILAVILSAVAAPPAFAQCAGVNADASGPMLVTPDTGGITCVPVYDGAVSISGQLDAAYDLGTVSMTQTMYDATGRLVSSTDSTGNTIQYSYNSAGELATVDNPTDPGSHVTMYSYNSQGELTSVTDPLGRTAMYTYNASGQLQSVTDPLGNTTMFTYDPGANQLVTDELGNITSYTYDAQGDITGAVEEPGALTTSNVYDATGRMVQDVTDPLGNTTSYNYSAGQVTSETELSNTTQYTYDASGNVTSATDGNPDVNLWYVNSVPEPTSAVLLASGGLLLLPLRRRR